MTAEGNGASADFADRRPARVERRESTTRRASSVRQPAVIPSTAEYVARYRAAEQKGAESILERGRVLNEAKRKLPGRFQAMVINELKISPRMAQLLMQIAGHPILSDAQWIAHLPASVGTLALLLRLPDEKLKVMFADGTIHGLEYSQAKEIVARSKNENATERVAHALKVLAAFRQNWPDPKPLARHVWNGIVEGEHAVSLDDLASLRPWVSALIAALRQEDAAMRAAQEAAE